MILDKETQETLDRSIKASYISRYLLYNQGDVLCLVGSFWLHSHEYITVRLSLPPDIYLHCTEEQPIIKYIRQQIEEKYQK